MSGPIKRRTVTFLAAVIIIILSLLMPAYAAAGSYAHDPMDNPKAAQDIVENPDAVYGYSPSPDSVRLRDYVDLDWTDEAAVDQMRVQREAYHASIQELYDLIASMGAAGDTTEEIARAVSTKRNEIRLEAYKDDPEGLEKVKQSNLDTYGNENGGTPEFFYEKYGSWETVLEKSLSANAGADACLGLYDKYYDTYILPASGPVGPVEDPASETYTVQSGDSLWKIAVMVYGDGALWRSIYELNEDTIKDADLIYPGQELKIR